MDRRCKARKGEGRLVDDSKIESATAFVIGVCIGIMVGLLIWTVNL